MDNESGLGTTIAVKDRPAVEFTTTPPEEYVVADEKLDKNFRIMDHIPPESNLTPELIQKLKSFENTLIAYREKAEEEGLPVGIDYFTSYKPGFREKFVGLGGAAAFAVIALAVARQVKDMRVLDKVTGKVMLNEYGEEVKVPVMYMGDSEKKGKSENPKFSTLNPNVDLTEEQIKYSKTFGKLPDDPRIIDRFSKFLRETSLDEVPQIMSLFWGYTRFFGPRSSKSMEARASKPRPDPKDPEAPPIPPLKDIYPEAYRVYYQANRVNNKGISKGFFNGYTAADDGSEGQSIRGGPEEAQFLAEAIFERNMCRGAESFILIRSIMNIASGRGAK